ncbi:protease subunit of ATP-dependent Clp protease [Pediococcus stilesii]|uniref:ATP-dependent Clp protease proteolytic subunit n=1 Tax=Pediococcus stilesii TaxID=331679 RepID=A0A0R2KYF0_9LACO|nr:protease subunit of ATP-dependent Clp protease [Pediococcus stilesii]
MKIDVKGPIISDENSAFYDYFNLPYTSPSVINDELSGKTDDIELVINSNGGDVYAASDIWTSLKSYSGKVTAKIYGMAASAASVIAMGADTLEMSPTARMMIHNSSTYGEGNHNDFDKISDVLKGTDKSIAQAYMDKTGKSEEEILDIMAQTTFYTADEALEAGLIDSVINFKNDNAEEAPLFENSNSGMIPQTVIDKFTTVALGAPISDDLVKNIADAVAKRLKNVDTHKPKNEQVNIDPFVF